ncbi:Mu-like prophage major head subunit gpT family protein [Nitrosomonas sp.]|uniref:Mu-like prophage major head subunit gpT family protein n=1 Tax=Nitrosomonas sp. TaxID=42353 RepID=UPI0037CAD532
MTAPIITERSVIGMFYERLQQNTASSFIDAIATTPFESDQDSENYAWLGMVPQMAEKRGEKKFSQLRATEWEIKNVEYQGGITLPKKHILYDKTTQVQTRVNELADRTTAHWWSLVAPLIVSGESSVCYDGQYFFDVDHSEGGSGAQSNSISADISAYPVSNHGTTTAPSAGEMVHAIMDGVQKMLGFKDDRGEYVNEDMNEFIVLVAPSLLMASLSALRASSIDGGDTNVIFEQDSFRFRIQASPRLSSWTAKFALFSTQGTQRPIVRQQRKPNNAAPGYSVDGMLMETLWLDSEHCKKHDECLVSVETERAAAYGDWKKACLVTLV